MKPILEVANSLGLPAEHVVQHGRGVARVSLDALRDAPTGAARPRYILVTSMTPTGLGAGKTTTAISLTQALVQRGRRAVATLRQSSMGPTFGRKGGGAGGGRAQLLPMDALLLGLTGDIDAVSLAHNLIVSLADNARHHGLEGAPDEVVMGRVVDVNDRTLRHLASGREGKPISHRTRFEISAASELMAILALIDGSDRAAVLADLRARLGQIVVGYRGNDAVTAEDVKAAGSAAVVMSRSIDPNLVQSTEGAPVLVHSGPFANIAHGCSSIVADRLAMAYAEDVVTEAGFGMDVGGQKFLDIKCRASGLTPDVVVLVATVRAMKLHSGRHALEAGEMPEAMKNESPDDALAGLPNLVRQLENAQSFGVPVVVAVNAFPTDHPSEVEAVREAIVEAGAHAAVICRGYAEGGAGALELADAVLAVPLRETPPAPAVTTPNGTDAETTMTAVARKFYGASGIVLHEPAQAALARFRHSGHGNLPVCIAKTWASLSHDKTKLGVPEPFELPIRDMRLSAGAGFIYALAGKILTMPGLGRHPAAHDIDIEPDGTIVGLK